ncbi:MAG: hypothetical protein KDA76_09800 [Planctomycetaceae bacterium]|nr:hypothetical protein [Planctomycetaceae bacterium]
MIQFECPHCQAVLRVPDSAMGQKGKCPKCGQSLLVPSLAAPPEHPAANAVNKPKETETVPATENVDDLLSTLGQQTPAASHPRTAEEAVGELFTALSHDSTHSLEVDPLLNVTARARVQNRASVLTGLFFILIAVGLGITVYFLLQPSLQGELMAQLLPPESLQPKLIPVRDLEDAQQFQHYLRDHEGRRIHMNSQYLQSSLEGTDKGLVLRIAPTGVCDVYRVNVLSNQALREYHAEHYGNIEETRLREFRQALREFFQQIGEAEDVLLGNPANLLQYRDRLILPGVVDALGYRLAAFSQGTQYPCVWQDKDDQLYFALPRGTKQFEVREREIVGQPRYFPANLRFTVSTDKVTDPKSADWDYSSLWDKSTPANQAAEPSEPTPESTEPAPETPDASETPPMPTPMPGS